MHTKIIVKEHVRSKSSKVQGNVFILKIIIIRASTLFRYIFL